jgi:NADH-quinone oxidoreductase subunit J
MNAVFFWFFSIAMIVCALAVVLGRNPVTSAICFAFTIFYMSALFVMLNAFFLAAVQILVTAGAVMVLFLFIIMLLDLTEAEKIPRQKVWMGCSLIACLGFLYVVALTLNATPEGAVGINSAPPPYAPSARTMAIREEKHPGSSEGFLVDLSDDTHRIGRLLFATNVNPTIENPWPTTYVAPFEVTSLLILVATIGVIVLCKQDEPRRPSPREQIVREAPPLEPKKETVSTR